MPPSTNRWIVAANWFAAALALAAAAVRGEAGVASAWVLSAALVATVVCLGWPQKGMPRAIGFFGLAWQMALIGAYWPFDSKQLSTDSMGRLNWNLPTLVILSLLVLLALSFLAQFLLPGLALRRRLGRARTELRVHQQHGLDLVADELGHDAALRHLWQQYRSQVRYSSDGAAPQAVHALASAREVFDLHTLTHSRLRLELFRNLPGIVTGLGIVGTFSGIIKGIRGLHYSQDPAEMQRVFDVLAGGVAEAFFVSMTAISLAMAITLAEKALMSSIAQALDGLNIGLDAVFPPRPAADDPAGAATAAVQGGAVQPMEPPPAVAPAPEAAVPARAATLRPLGLPADDAMPLQAAQTAQMAQMAQTAPPAAAIDWPAQLLEVTTQTQAATQAMAELARGLPALLAEQTQAAGQGQQQTTQALRSLSSRLEGVASSIEVSGRRTLETVASRLMQAEMQMVSRNQAVAEHLGELVQRIETLCSLMQEDRSVPLPHAGPDPFASLMGETTEPNPPKNALPSAIRRAAPPQPPSQPMYPDTDPDFGASQDWPDLWAPEQPGPRGFGA